MQNDQTDASTGIALELFGVASLGVIGVWFVGADFRGAMCMLWPELLDVHAVWLIDDEHFCSRYSFVA